MEYVEEVWHFASFESIHLNETSHRPMYIVKIPSTPSCPKDILNNLQVCNLQLPIHDWNEVRVAKQMESFRRATVVLNSDYLSPLQKAQGVVFYGFEITYLCAYRGDGNGNYTARETSL